jgi:hypothetical protein
VAYPVGLGIGQARMIYVTSEVLSASSVDRPTAVDLVEIAVASGLKFISLIGRKLLASVRKLTPNAWPKWTYGANGEQCWYSGEKPVFAKTR